MTPANNVISQTRRGNRKSTLDFCDNSPIGEYILDALDTFPPEDGLADLKRLHKRLGELITSKEGASKAWDAPNAPPRQERPGLLTDPYRGLVDRVDYKDIPTHDRTGFVRVYKVHTGAAVFDTYDRSAALEALHAQRTSAPVTLKWRPRQNGRHLNYDLVSLRVLDPHGRTQL